MTTYVERFNLDPDLVPLALKVVTMGYVSSPYIVKHTVLPGSYLFVRVTTPDPTTGQKGSVNLLLPPKDYPEPQIPKNIKDFMLLSYLGYDLRLNPDHVAFAQRGKDAKPVMFDLCAIIVKDRGVITLPFL
jgi:hypothetical protein